MRFYNITEIINEKVYYNKYKKRKNTLNIYLKNVLTCKNN